MIRHHTTGFEKGIFRARLPYKTKLYFPHERPFWSHIKGSHQSQSSSNGALRGGSNMEQFFKKSLENHVKNYFSKNKNKIMLNSGGREIIILYDNG
jgi:hypothetical protein